MATDNDEKPTPKVGSYKLPPSQTTVKAKGSDEKLRTGVETGMDGTLRASTAISRDTSDKRHTHGDFDNVREVPPTAWYEDDDRPTVANLMAMRTMDGQARALYRLIVLPLRAALDGVDFVADDGGDAEAEFIKTAMLTPQAKGGMSVTFSRFMAQLMQGIFDGTAVFEKVFWVPKDGPLKGKVTLRKLAYRPANTITFLADEHGGFAGFRQVSHNGDKPIDTLIPVPYAFYYAAQEEERKFYGVSYFESAFFHYDKKVRIYFASHLAAQRSAIPARKGQFPATAQPDDIQEFQRQLEDLGLAQWISMPEGFEVEILQEQTNFDFLGWVNHHNSQMSKSILAPFFDSDSGAGKNDGSVVSMGTPDHEMFMLMLAAIQKEIADQINHYIIPQLIDFNFKSKKYPTMKWGELTDEQNRAIARTFDKLAGNPQNLTPQFVRELEVKTAERLGLSIDYEDIPLQTENYAGAFTPQIAAGLTDSGQAGAGISENSPTPPGMEGVDPLSPEFENALVQQEDQGAVPLSAEEYEELFALSQDDDTAIDLASGSGRRVRTDAGAARYGKPIGTVITEGGKGGGPGGKAPTLERLLSLRRQYTMAARYGNTALMARVRRAFSEAVTQFTAGKGDEEVQEILRQLNAEGPQKPGDADLDA